MRRLQLEVLGLIVEQVCHKFRDDLQVWDD